MICPNCREGARAEANFCHRCGVMLRAFCVVCRIELPEDSHFCFKCGQSLSGSFRFRSESSHPPLTSKEKIPQVMPIEMASGDRRFVAVLFADLSGFTAMSEKLDAEKVTDIVNQCFKRLGKLVYDLGGHIDKYMGDCIMALFGAPIAHENDPELAVDCALRMLSELERFNLESGNDLGMSIGINAGMVVAGGVGSNSKVDYTVMGDAVNTAQRLQSNAKRGQILVSRSVKRASEKVFEFEALPPLKVKGKEEAIEAYHVLSRKKVSIENDRAQDYQEPALIGREVEIEIIKKLLNEIKENRGQILLFSGEPGIGKSRLRSEMSKLARNQDVQYFESKCSSLTRETPYFLFSSLLKNIFQIDSRSDHASQSERLKALEKFELDKISKVLIRELLHLSSPEDSEVKVEASQKKSLINHAIKNLIVEISKTKCGLIYLEDLQWIDSLSREVLQLLLDAVPRLPLMISGGLRPDFVHDWSHKKNFTQLNLAPLTSDQCLQLVRRMLNQEELPVELQDLVEKKCDGNPLYAEEIVKNLQDMKALIFENKTWRMSSQFKADQVPATLQGLIASRIDLLSESAKIVLQYAAVVGRRFTLNLLSSLVPDPEKIQEVLYQLKQRELIFEVSSSSQDVLFSFNHALMQDVAYQSILLKNRRLFHSRVARLIECDLEKQSDSNKSDFFEALSYHYQEAENFEKAIEYLFKFGKALHENYENIGSLKAFERAIEIFEREKATQCSVKIEDLYSEIAMVLAFVGNFSRSEEFQNKVIAIAEASGEKSQLSRSYRYLGETYRKQGHFDRALEASKNALRLAVEASDFEAQVRAWKSLANTYKELQNLSKAMEILEEGLAAARALGRKRLIAEYLNDMATVQMEKNELDLAAKKLEETISVAQKERELKSLLASATNNLGLISQLRGDFSDARNKYSAAAAVAIEIGDLKNIVIAKNNLAEVMIELGELKDAIAELDQTLQYCQTSGNQFGRVSALILRAWIQTHLNQVVEGEDSLSLLIEECAQRKYWGLFTDAHCFLGRSQSKRSDFKAAELTLNRAIVKMTELGNLQAVARCQEELKKMARSAQSISVSNIKV